jgi:hypothetical protein
MEGAKGLVADCGPEALRKTVGSLLLGPRLLESKPSPDSLKMYEVQHTNTLVRDV